MELIIAGLLLLGAAGYVHYTLYREASPQSKHPYIVKITKRSGKVVYGVKYHYENYAGSGWSAEDYEFTTPEAAQRRVNKLNDRQTTKTERYVP